MLKITIMQKEINYLPEEYYPDIGAINFLVREGLQRNLLQNGKTHGFLEKFLPIESTLDLALERLVIFHHHDELKSLFWRSIQMCFYFVGVAETNKASDSTLLKDGASTSLSAPLINFGCIVKQYREEINIFRLEICLTFLGYFRTATYHRIMSATIESSQRFVRQIHIVWRN